jgi:hypothetical protein
MARGLPTSGTIYLSQVKNAFAYDASNVRRTDTITTANANSTVTAPSDAYWVKIEVWGGGGGGRGYSVLNDYGGGGGGYAYVIIPVTPGSTVIGYEIGWAGTGGAPGANGISGGATYAYIPITIHSGSTHYWMVGYPGIRGTTGAGLGGNGGGPSVEDAGGGGGTDATTSVGGNAGDGTLGGQTNGAAGTSPGGGGAPGITSGTTGGNGGSAQFKATWYGKPTTNNLRGYLAGGSIVNPGAAGASRNIPASGTINLRDFIAAEEFSGYGNTSLSFQSGGADGTQWANCTIRADGTFAPGIDRYWQTWMRNLLGLGDSTTSQYFDVLFNRTFADGYDTTLYGSAANTWIQCSTAPSWNVKTFLSGYGVVSSTASGYLAFRRRSDNVVLMNVAFSITAVCDNPDPGDTK